MSDDEGPVALPPERTLEQLEARHEREEEELKERGAKHVEEARAAAGKGKKAKALVEAAEREVEEWEYKLRTRQQEEVQRLQVHLEGGGAKKEEVAEMPAVEERGPTLSPEEEEAERARRKKEKALQKRQNRQSKEAEREAERERERLQAGPSARVMELLKLQRLLSSRRPPLRVHEIAADGHCLYRAVGDQLRRVRPDLHRWQRPADKVHEEVREMCARRLRAEPDGYSPFAELKDGEDFEAYCGRVENSGDWGGELELRALADALGVCIEVYRADEPEPLRLGEPPRNGDAPLRVAFHRFYYALGEHYNSVLPASEDGE